MGLSSIKHGAPPSFILGFHSETEQRAQGGGRREGEIAMKRPSPLSTKLYKKGGMRKIACLFHGTMVERSAWPSYTCVCSMLKQPETIFPTLATNSVAAPGTHTYSVKIRSVP